MSYKPLKTSLVSLWLFETTLPPKHSLVVYYLVLSDFENYKDLDWECSLAIEHCIEKSLGPKPLALKMKTLKEINLHNYNLSLLFWPCRWRLWIVTENGYPSLVCGFPSIYLDQLPLSLLPLIKTNQNMCARATVNVLAVRGQLSKVSFHLLPWGRVSLVSVAVLASCSGLVGLRASGQFFSLHLPANSGIPGLQMYTIAHTFYVYILGSKLRASGFLS